MSINFHFNFKTFNFNIFFFLLLNIGAIFIGLYDKFIIHKYFGNNLLSQYYLVFLFCMPAQLFISSVNQGLLPQMYNNNFFDLNFFFFSKVKKIFVCLIAIYFATYFFILLLCKIKFIPNTYANVSDLFLVSFVGLSIVNILPLINSFLIKNNLYRNLYLFNFGIIFVNIIIFTYLIQFTNIFLTLSLFSISLLVLLLLEFLFLKNYKYDKY